MAGWRVVAVCSIAGILGGAGSAFAQTAQPSLAEVARQESERRKAVGQSGKVYTNDDTKSGRPLTTGSASLAKAAAAAQERSAEASGPVRRGRTGQGPRDGPARVTCRNRPGRLC